MRSGAEHSGSLRERFGGGCENSIDPIDTVVKTPARGTGDILFEDDCMNDILTPRLNSKLDRTRRVPGERSCGRRREPGFTLIELLIVVAIIAILAAIAVPNFLEAQTRSKASRAMADLRSIATALEMYNVDNQHYPTMLEPGFAGGVAPLAGSDLKWWYTPDSLSTPIAYLSSANLGCPFGGDRTRSGDFPDEIWRRYSYENIPELESKYLEGYAVLQAKYAPAARALETCGAWRILCIGPDIVWNPMVAYDATNGTISLGNLMRTQRESVVR